MKGSKVWQLSTCSVIALFKYIQVFHGRSADTNLTEIHEEMSELLDKQVNVQKESLKNFQGSCKLPQAHEKVCDETERKKDAM